MSYIGRSVNYGNAVIQRAEWLGFDPNLNINLTYKGK